MKLLFKREQSSNKLSKAIFKLWGKIEIDDDEKALIERYDFDESILMHEDTPNLMRNSMLVGLGSALLVYLLLGSFLPQTFASILALLALGGSAYWWYHEKRETIYVKDIMHGRHFSCDSIIDLSKKEAYLLGLIETFRQVMESAKHWDGTEDHVIPVLSKEEARQLVASL